MPVTLHDLRRARRQRHRHLPACPTSSAASGWSRSRRSAGAAAGSCRRASPTAPATVAAAREPGPGGRGGQAAGLDLPAGRALARLDQGQARADRRLRDRRLAARPPRRWARCWSACPGRTACTTAAGSAAASRPRPNATCWPGWRRCRDAGSPFADAAARARTPRAPPTSRPELVVEVRYGNLHPGRPAALPPVRAAAARTRRPDGGRRCLTGRCSVHIAGRELELSNLDKVLYPAAGFTKGEVIDYYVRVAPVLLPHLRGPAADPDPVPERRRRRRASSRRTRPAARRPGCAGRRLPVPGSATGRETLDFIVVDERGHPGLAGQPGRARAAHPTVEAGRVRPADPDLLVVDLDPGPPAGLAECCLVARRGPAPAAARRARPRTPRPPARRACSCSAGCPATQTSDEVSALRQGGRRGPGARAARAGHREDDQERCGRARSSSTGARTSPPRRRSSPYSLRARADADRLRAADLGRGRGRRGRGRSARTRC